MWDLMDPLDFLTQEELIRFFHCKKTEISCIKEPTTFLNQLRDYNLVPEKLYKKVINMRSQERRQKGVYEILDWLEKERGHCVELFWSCVFENHILQKYPIFILLRNSLMDGSFKFYEKLPDTEAPNNNEDKAAQKEEKKVKGRKEGGKRKKSVEEAEEDDEEPGPSSCSTPTRKKPVKKPMFYSPLHKGEKPAIWTWNFFKSSFQVICGDKTGTLYRNKLAKGLKCILSDSQWFTPSDFEKFAGKGKYKNWKVSIRCQTTKTTLKTLIQEGHLQCPRIRRHCVRKSQRVLFPVSSSESSSSQSESSVEMEGSNEEQEEEREEDEEEEEEEEGNDEEKEEEEIEEEEEESEPVDLAKFEGPVLQVSCGSVPGDLYKKRFAGQRRKSIRTEERWFTPEEFVQQNVTLTDGRWKKDILCHGESLNYLVKRNILEMHSLLCDCDRCCPKNPQDDNNDDVCFICNSARDDDDDDGELVCCDECPRAFHKDCHLPTADNKMEKWMCTFCVCKINQQMWTHMSLENALKSSVTQHIMRCEYLLLCLYKEDAQRVFTDDPRTTVLKYSSVVSNPMWLNRVKAKLQANKYSTVGEFIGDIRLMFQNCQTFNKDNDFHTMGARLSEMFEQKLRIVFKIQ